VTLGALAALIALLAAAAAPFAAWTVLARVHVTHGWGNPTLSGTYLLALLALATAVSLASYQLARRWGAPTGLAAGGLLPWVLLTLLLAALEPAASYPLAWPFLFASVALAISVGTNSPAARLVALLSEWLAVIVGGVMLAQWVWLPFFGLGLRGLTAAWLGGLVALGAWLAAGRLAVFEGPRWWMVPVVALGAALSLAGVELSTVRFDLETPRKDVLFYELDARARSARWLGVGPLDEWTRHALGDEPSAVEIPDLVRLSPLLPFFRGPWLACPAPKVPLPPPQVRVLADSVGADGFRRITLRATSARNARAIMLSLRGAPVVESEMNGHRLPKETLRRRGDPWGLRLILPTSEGVVVSLHLPAGRPLMLDLIDESPGLPTVAGAPSPRPPGVVPVHTGDLTIVRTSFAL